MLTDTAIKRAQPKGKPYRLTDGRGLYLLVNPNGSKYWRLDYTVGGRRNTLSLGRPYPDTSLALARERCDEARKLVAVGIDPAAERKATKTAAVERTTNTFEAVAREWLSVKQHEWATSHYDKEALRLEKHAFPWIGDRPMMEIGVDDYLPCIRRVFNAGHLEQAHRLREQLSRVSRYAIATNRAKLDPAHALSAVLPAPHEKGFPSVVKPDEIGALLRAMDGFKGTFVVGSAMRLAPYLFCRPNELRRMEWAHLHDLDGDSPEYRVPPANRKIRRALKESGTAEPHIVPLSAQAVAILRELYPLTGRRQYVFPGELTRARASFNALWQAVGGQAQNFGERRGLHERLEVFAMDMQELGWAMAERKEGTPPHAGMVSPGSDAMSLVNELRRATSYARTIAGALDKKLQCKTYGTLAALLDAAAWEGYDKIYSAMHGSGGVIFDDFDGATRAM